MKYKVILFDADGMTIVSERFSARMQREHGISWETMKPFFDDPFQQCKLGKADLKEELEKVISDWGWSGTVDSLIEYWFQGDKVSGDIIAIVRELQNQGVKCYLATNQEKYRAEYLRTGLGLGKVFDGLFVSCEIGHLKDDSAFFEETVSRLAQPVESQEVLFVDHDEKNILAAQKAGLSTHVFRDIQTFKSLLG